MKFKMLLVCLIALAAACPVVAQSSGKDERAFKSLTKQMTDAQIAYDAAALDKIFAADYVEISPLGAFDSREKVMGFYSPQAKAAAGKVSVSVEAVDYSIRSYDKFGVLIARLNYTLTNEGKPLAPLSMRATLIFRKEKDLWKIASAQYTGIRQPTPPQKTN